MTHPSQIGRICVACVMDESDLTIRFDDDGTCHHCIAAQEGFKKLRARQDPLNGALAALAAQIKAAGAGKPYDAVLGLSGGVDSSYVAWLAHTFGLRVLAVHMDNGWNAEIAVSNIRGIIDRCGLALDTVVIDWPEFRDLQRAFIQAGVVDIEMLTDHAISGALKKTAIRHRASYILSGTNYATEHGMPAGWTWNKQDLVNIRDIHRRFGTVPLRTFPQMGLIRSVLQSQFGHGARVVAPLDLVPYRRDRAMAVLAAETGWRNYGAKHQESTFTKFYQAYILPLKFGIDKRKPHLSALIRNGEITRDGALQALAQPAYAPADAARDKVFVLKKLGFSEAEFDRLMAAPAVPHDSYRSDLKVRLALRWLMDRVSK